MLGSVLANSNASYWLPERASSVAPGVDGLFDFVLWICAFFFVLIVVLLAWFLVRYRHREGRETESAAGHSNALELTWTIIPTVLVLMIFYYGFRGYMHMAVEPPNAYEITAQGQMWNWSFTYPNGHVDRELHVPADRPVRIVLTSSDVIHSLFIPAFRMKKDVVPGRYNRMWFTATAPGTYDVYCAEYCGTNHSAMLTKAVVHDAGEFRGWLDRATEAENNLSPVDAGRKIYETRGCKTCHSLDGTRIVGPSFKDLFGSTVPLADGSSVPGNEDYVRESILYPQAKVHAGFQPVMPPFLGQLKDRDVNNVIAFFKTISANTRGKSAGSAAMPATMPAAPPDGMPAGK